MKSPTINSLRILSFLFIHLVINVSYSFANVKALKVESINNNNVLQSSTDQQLFSVKTRVNPGETISNFQLNNASTVDGHISKISIYYTGTSNTFATTTLFGSLTNPTGNFSVTGTQALSSGATVYFWIAVDVSAGAILGDFVNLQVIDVTFSISGASVPSVLNTGLGREIAVAPAPVPNPGGVSDATVWLKATADVFDNGSPVTDGDAVETWEEQTGNPNFNLLTQTTSNQKPTFSESEINYNPVVSTDGSNDIMLSNSNLTDTDLSISGNISYYTVFTQTSGYINQVWNGNSQSKYGFEGAVCYANGDVNPGNPFLLGSSTLPTVRSFQQIDPSGDVIGYLNNKNVITGSSDRLSIGNYSEKFSIGALPNSDRPAQAKIAEIVIFDGIHTVTERTKIYSYLAIKHGVTLDNSLGGIAGDYLSTLGTNIWDASVAHTYHNDVIGIGRDDIEALLQHQSHTLDDITRVYLGPSIATSNSVNSTNFSQDESYILIGHNNGQMCATTVSNAEMPSCTPNLYSRLEREWKITKTGVHTADVFTLDFTLSTCAVPGSVNNAHLRFLVDDDGDFSNGGTTCYYNGDASGTVISYSGSTITVSNITNFHLATNTTHYVTIGSIDVLTPLPTELLNFNATSLENRTVQLDWTTVTEINNDYFTIEKSIDGNNWVAFQNVQGAGNSTEIITYQDFDYTPFNGTSYYRLKQTDFDGNFTYSTVRIVNFNENATFLVYPNPTNGKITIKASEEELESLHIFNVIGEEIIDKTKIDYISETEIDIDFGDLAKGVYYIRTNTNTEMLVVK